MGQHSMKVMLTVLGLILAVNAQTAIGQICSNSGGGGSCVTVFDNSVFTNMATTVVGDNAASSMGFWSGGYYIDIYDGINYGGATKRYRTNVDVPNLSNESPSWNDKISSVKITPVPLNAPGLAIWKDSNYGSAYQYFDAGDVTDINAATGFPNSAASSSRQWPYTLAYMFQNTGGVNQCSPPTSCAIYSAATTSAEYDVSLLSPNDKAKSLYVAAYQTPTTTTAAVTTTAAATTTQAVTASTSTLYAATLHDTVTTAQAAANGIGGFKRTDEEKGGKGKVPS